MLSMKQAELETLRENLAVTTKMSGEYKVRCEILALWSGKGKTVSRIKTLQMKCFLALKQNKEFKKHSKLLIE